MATELGELKDTNWSKVRDGKGGARDAMANYWGA